MHLKIAIPLKLHLNAFKTQLPPTYIKTVFFVLQMNLAGLSLPLLNDIEKKKKEIEGTKTYMYKDDDIEAVNIIFECENVFENRCSKWLKE